MVHELTLHFINWVQVTQSNLFHQYANHLEHFHRNVKGPQSHKQLNQHLY